MTSDWTLRVQSVESSGICTKACKDFGHTASDLASVELACLSVSLGRNKQDLGGEVLFSCKIGF